MKFDKILLHQYVLFGVLSVILLRDVVGGSFVIDLGLLWWLLGAVLGFLFVFIDSFVYGLLTQPNTVWTDKLKSFFNKRVLRRNLEILLQENQETKVQIMRSILFIFVWCVLGILTMSSIASNLSKGFMLGIGTHLVFDFVYDYFYDQKRFELWFWQIKRDMSHQEKRNVMILVVFVYFVLSSGL